jgi:hypothetical protein
MFGPAFGWAFLFLGFAASFSWAPDEASGLRELGAKAFFFHGVGGGKPASYLLCGGLGIQCLFSEGFLRGLGFLNY